MRRIFEDEISRKGRQPDPGQTSKREKNHSVSQSPKTPKGPFPSLSVRLKIVYNSRLKPTAKAVLAYYCWRVDAVTGETYVGVERTSRETGRSTRTVEETNLHLINEHWIERRRRPNKSAVTALRAEAFEEDIEPAETADPVPSGPAIAAEPNAQQPRPGPAVAAGRSRTSRTQSGPSSGPLSRNKSSGVHDDLALVLQTLKENHVDHSERRIKWAIHVVKGRSKTPPASVAYYEKSVAGVFANLERETCQFLKLRLIEGLNGARRVESVSETAETLKQMAAENDLPYDTQIINTAIQEAEIHLDEKWRGQSSLRVGRHE